MARNTLPLTIPTAAVHESMVLLLQLGIGTVRTRPALSDQIYERPLRIAQLNVWRAANKSAQA